ncbi:hypothetical protein [Ascidiimonas sp. W6]|uniref:hypothetical protein n=1 Tax=Ascidiimonas meishanensis TaxID=3128903 RepID=UPI0030EC2539
MQVLINLKNNSSTDLVNPKVIGNVNPPPPPLIAKGASFTCNLMIGNSSSDQGGLFYTENANGTSVGIQVRNGITPEFTIRNRGTFSSKIINEVTIEFNP